MAYAQVADPNLDAGKPIRSVDIKGLRDNQDWFNSELARVDRDASVFAHFARYHGYASDLILDGSGGAGPGIGTQQYWDEDFRFYCTSGAGDTLVERLGGSATDDRHYLRGTGEFRIDSVRAWEPQNITLPLTMTVRFRGSALGGGTAVYIGLASVKTGSALTDPAGGRGVWIEQSSAANWVFASDDNSTHNTGTPFARPSNDTWAEIQIVYDSSNVECFVDSVSKEVFSTDLPDDAVLFGTVGFQDMGNVDIDRIQITAGSGYSDYA